MSTEKKKGERPTNKNLIRSMDFTPEERRARASKAGKASAAARRAKKKELTRLKTFAEKLDYMFKDVEQGDGLTLEDKAVVNLAKEVAKGKNEKLIRLLLAILNESPNETIRIDANVTKASAAIDEVIDEICREQSNTKST